MRLVSLLPILALTGCVATTHEDCAVDYEAERMAELAAIEQGMQVMVDIPEAERTDEQRAVVEAAMAIRESRERVADRKDLEIVRRAKVIMRDADQWNREDERDCERRDQGVSLFCSLVDASLAATGTYVHRRTVIQEVRYAVEEASVGRDYEHRLQDFNNDPDFTRADMIAVLEVAEDRLSRRLLRQAACAL